MPQSREVVDVRMPQNYQLQELADGMGVDVLIDTVFIHSTLELKWP